MPLFHCQVEWFGTCQSFLSSLPPSSAALVKSVHSREVVGSALPHPLGRQPPEAGLLVARQSGWPLFSLESSNALLGCQETSA